MLITKNDAEELISCLIYCLNDFLKDHLKDYADVIDDLEEHHHECVGNAAVLSLLGTCTEGPTLGPGTRAFLQYMLDRASTIGDSTNAEIREIVKKITARQKEVKDVMNRSHRT